MPVAGANPLDIGGLELGQPQQGWEPLSTNWGKNGWVETGKWVCEEIKLRYVCMLSSSCALLLVLPYGVFGLVSYRYMY